MSLQLYKLVVCLVLVIVAHDQSVMANGILNGTNLTLSQLMSVASAIVSTNPGMINDTNITLAQLMASANVMSLLSPAIGGTMAGIANLQRNARTSESAGQTLIAKPVKSTDLGNVVKVAARSEEGEIIDTSDFKLIDTDGHGSVTMDEYLVAAKAIGFFRVSMKDIIQCFADLDTNGGPHFDFCGKTNKYQKTLLSPGNGTLELDEVLNHPEDTETDPESDYRR